MKNYRLSFNKNRNHTAETTSSCEILGLILAKSGQWRKSGLDVSISPFPMQF